MNLKKHLYVLRIILIVLSLLLLYKFTSYLSKWNLENYSLKIEMWIQFFRYVVSGIVITLGFLDWKRLRPLQIDTKMIIPLFMMGYIALTDVFGFLLFNRFVHIFGEPLLNILPLFQIIFGITIVKFAFVVSDQTIKNNS